MGYLVDHLAHFEGEDGELLVIKAKGERLAGLEGEEAQLVDLPSAFDGHLPLYVTQVIKETIIDLRSTLFLKLLHQLPDLGLALRRQGGNDGLE